ncbi:MAG: response regulator [Phycisphaera sp.]|nr:response regulator [Phycisphaera sp.]
MKVLVIEDYAPLRESLCQGLREEGYTVESAGDGEDGLWKARNTQPGVVVLDLMLPKVDGLTLLKRLRESDKQTPVLILTARGGVDDRVAGLNLGADDYLPKPFAFAELLARVGALVRRRYEQRSPRIDVGKLCIDTAQRKVTLADEEVHLTPREYHLLELLARHAGDVVSRQDIWNAVYEFESDSSSNVVDVYVSYLRRKLDRPNAPSMIETVRGHGYRLVQEPSHRTTPC